MEGDLHNPELYGIIPRSAEYIFNGLQKEEYISHSILVSYLEIYNEELCDLLLSTSSSSSSCLSSNSSTSSGNENTNMNSMNNTNMNDNTHNNHQKLDIMECRDGVICRGLTEKQVYSAEDVLAVMKTAQKHKKVGETAMNSKSSRSHCVFTIRVSAQKRLHDGRIFDTRGKLHLVDLAGSECARTSSSSSHSSSSNPASRCSSPVPGVTSPLDSNGRRRKKESSPSTKVISKERGRERSNINRSLLTLGRVILMLNKQSSSRKSGGNIRIPYRDSKLTRILQNSLGGKCKTLIIATLSPSEEAIDETMSTLNYAQTASGIVNKPVAVSYLKYPDTSRSSAPLKGKGLEEVKGVEHWYQMEMKVGYLEAQLEEAQAALARHYEDQRTIVERAEKAEDELDVTKKKLEASEQNYRKSLNILREAKQIISAQQHEIKNAKVEQKRCEKTMMKNVLQGVSDLVSGQVNYMSAEREDRLTQVEKQHHALNSVTNNVNSSARNILKEVDAKNVFVLRQSEVVKQNNESMIMNSKMTSAALSDLDKLWNRQKQFVDRFVAKTNEKAEMLAEHEVAAATACSNLERDCSNVGTFITGQVSDSMHSGTTQLSDLANIQSKYGKGEVLSSTSNHYKEMRKLQTTIVSNYSSTADNIFKTVDVGKENIGSIMNKQCDLIDELRCDVETKCEDFGSDASKKRRPAIDGRNSSVIDNSNDFNQLAECAFSSTTVFTSTLKEDTDRFGKETVNVWAQVPPVKERRRIEYCNTLSSTPADEVLLKDFKT